MLAALLSLAPGPVAADGSEQAAGAALRGARALEDGRDREAVRALERARRGGVPDRALRPLLLAAYLRLGDRERAVAVARRWGQGAPAVVRRLLPPRLRAQARIAAGWDSNVRLDPTQGAGGVAAPLTMAGLRVEARPLGAVADLRAAVSLEQRVHLASRTRSALYDLGVLGLSLAAESGLRDEALQVEAETWGETISGELWARHLALAGGAALRGAWHPLGPHAFGLQAVLEARDLDGAALRDPSLDDQDGVEIRAGPFVRLGLGRAVLELAAGYDQTVARASSWSAAGVAAGATATLSAGRWSARAHARYRFAAYGAAGAGGSAAIEHGWTGGLEGALSLGPVSPFAGVSGEAIVGREERQASRVVALAGVSAAWSSGP